ncbi:MAG: cell division protein CrgA [Acidimicrobiia bacterium]|nr:cell division protein CrgA [Acidimicrobiia bacterium]
MPVSKGRKNKANKRPTPPKRKPTSLDTKGPSPTWYVVTMFGLMAVGTLVILANYVGLMPGGTENVWLLLGLVGIGVGFTMTMGYR